MRFKYVIALVMTVILMMSMAGCGSGDKKETKIGVAMPTHTRQRWNQDGANIERKLIEQGYSPDLKYADNDKTLQVSQINDMINEGCKVLIVAAVDVNALADILDKARSKGITVIAYDRLIMNTDAVDYYATFDNFAVGTMQGEYIEEKLNLKSGAGPFNLEIIGGALDDNNAVALFEGAMDVLRPYIKSGQLVVRSGQTELQACATIRWSDKIARDRLAGIIDELYNDAVVDAVLCANDSTAYGAISALKDAGYGAGGKKMPIITGQDADKKNVKAILMDEQTMSIFKDTRILADESVKMVNAILSGKEPETNDIGNYNNGVKIVPTFLIRPQFVDKSNYKALLIDSGYYTENDIQ